MRAFLILAAVLAALPALADVPAADPVKPTGTIPRSIFALDDKGDATHLQSGWQCPSAFGDYRRHDLHNYDAYGLDVSCDYGEPDGDITLYLTKRDGGDMKADFESAKTALVNRVAGDATPLADADQKTFPSDRDWLHMIYSRRNGTVMDGVWFAWYGGWEFEIRATYRADRADATFVMLSQMADAARATGEHLARCAKSEAPLRDGTMLTDGDRIMGLDVLVGGLGAGAHLRHDAAGKLPAGLSHPATEWCAEGSAGVDGVPVLLWHGLGADGAAVPADRASIMTYDDPPVLEISSEPVLNLIDNSSADKKPIFVAIMARGDDRLVLGYFDGRPGAAALTPLLKGIDNGTAPVLMRFNVNSNNIAVSAPDKK
jgi:hypothetical protein